MTWVKLDDGFTDHPKVVGLSDRAFRTHVRALCYCGRFSPGIGRIPASALRKLGATPGVVTELLAVVLWEEGKNGDLFIHDFSVYHPKTDREAKAEAGRLGGLASGQARRSKHEAEMKQGASSLLQPNRTPVPGPARPVPLASYEADPAAADLPPPVREIRDTIMAKLPSKFQRDPAVWDEALSFAQDYAGLHDALAIAIAAVRRQPNTLPFPGNLRLHMPPLEAQPRASPSPPTLLNPMADGWPDARPEPDGTLPPKLRSEVKS